MAGYNNVTVVRGLGKPGANEAGLKNWVVFVDTDSDGVRDAEEEFTYTDDKGNYSFELAAGSYRIEMEKQPGWTQTTPTNPTYRQVTVVANERKYYLLQNQILCC